MSLLLRTLLGPSVDIQYFTGNGTWTKPTGAKLVDVLCVSPGVGGGSGRRGAPGTVRQGGGGGTSGGVSRQTIPAVSLPATVAVTCGVGSTGGAAVTTDDTNGNPPGSVAGIPKFGTYVFAGISLFPSASGGGGTGAGGLNSTPGTGMAVGSASGAASTTGLVGGNAGASLTGGAGAGGAGGGISTANVASAGGVGSNIQITNSIIQTGGVPDGALPLAAVTQPVNSGLPGHGGGGGASSITQAAQAGADGGWYGAGGGGGGASTNGFASGKGGEGAPGIVIVTTYF
jgi:hypothetical protein